MTNASVREKFFYLESSNQFKFSAKSYYPEQDNPRAIIQIVHGMTEHMGRYHDFARYMASQGIAVYLHDHPGHGQDALRENRLGVIPWKRGWQVMLENTRALYTHIRKTRPEIPLFLLGHSMGSVLARHFMAVYPVYLKGLILSGPADLPSWQLNILRTITRLQGIFAAPHRKSKWFNRLFYHNFNRHFKERPTRFEWITSQREEADAYNNDPLCGFDCSVSFYNNIFKGMAAMKKTQHNLKYRKTLPLLIISGQQDPVGNWGKEAIKIHQDFYKQNFHYLTVKIFNGRHELLHESIKQQVYEYLANWMDECLTKKKIVQ
ncbi:MAG: alpha/beta hydrolase [Bacteroidales bacterium]